MILVFCPSFPENDGLFSFKTVDLAEALEVIKSNGGPEQLRWRHKFRAIKYVLRGQGLSIRSNVDQGSVVQNLVPFEVGDHGLLFRPLNRPDLKSDQLTESDFKQTSHSTRSKQMILPYIQTAIVIIGAVWAYFRFFREGTHNPRVQFDIDCDFLGPQNGRYVAAFTVTAKNCGHIEQHFKEIRIRMRGIENGVDLITWNERPPLLEFPLEEFDTYNIIPSRSEYFFVRPGVEQRFSFVTSVPENWKFILARATFKYQKTNEIHTAEKALMVSATNDK